MITWESNSVIYYLFTCDYSLSLFRLFADLSVLSKNSYNQCCNESLGKWSVIAGEFHKLIEKKAKKPNFSEKINFNVASWKKWTYFGETFMNCDETNIAMK